MKKYNWTIYNIEDRLYRLYSMLNKEKNPTKKHLIELDISSLQNYIDEYFDNTIYDQETLLTEYAYRKENFNNFDFLKNDFNDFNEIAKDAIVPPALNNVSLSKEDILELSHDFFKTLDHYFFSNFARNYARKLDHIIFHNNTQSFFHGSTISILALKEAFIEVNRDNTLMDIITTIHEYMHATSAIINPCHFFDNKYIFSELDTAFIELLAADYIDKTFKNDNGSIIKGFNHIEIASEAADLTDTFKLIGYEKDSHTEISTNKQLKTMAMLACDLEGGELETLLYTPDTDPETYVTSYIFAIELYDLYKQDKEKALYLLRKIIELNCLTLEDYYKEIKNNNLYPNDHMASYHKDLQKKIQLVLRKNELKNQK